MTQSKFDAASFLNTEVNAQFATEFTPCPEGEFPGQILEVTPRTVNTKNGEKIIVGVKWMILDQAVAEKMGNDQPTIRQDIWIDMEDNGTLSTGTNKNIGLGRLRKALKQDAADRPWSFAMLNGGSARIKVKHSLDGDKIRSEVSDVTGI